MGVRAVVIVQRQLTEEVDILREVRLLPQSLDEGFVVNGGIAVRLREKVVLVGDDGEVDPCARVRHEILVEVAEALGGVVDGAFVHRIFEICGIAVLDINAVVVLLPVDVELVERLECAPLVAQRELVERIALKVGHEFAAEHGVHADGGKLFEPAPLAERETVGGLERRPRPEAEKKRGKEHDGHDIFDAFVHPRTPLEAEIQERIE